MRKKRIATILIAGIFGIALLISCFLCFTIRKVDINFFVSDSADTTAISQTLNEYNGKNIIFLNKDKVKQSINDPYFEITEVKKDFPNVLSVFVKERKETFFIASADKVYVCSQEGILLKVIDGFNTDNLKRENIFIRLEGMKITEDTLGGQITSDDQELLNLVFDMAKAVNLTDCIKEIKITDSIDELMKTAVFTTYTGVNIMVENATVKSIEKIEKAFNAYDSASDYQKSYKNIIVSGSETGEISITWTEEVVG